MGKQTKIQYKIHFKFSRMSIEGYMNIIVEIYVYFIFMFIMNCKVKFIIELSPKRFMIIFIRTFTQL